MMNRTAIAILLLVGTLPLAAQESASTSMRVSAQVIARAVADVDAGAVEVVVTPEDIARGYVDVAEPLTVRLRTNSRNGCLLQVANTSPAFSAIELEFGNTRMRVTEESWVARPYVPGGEVVVAQMRMRLANDAAAGRYALPIQVSASPL